LLRPRGSSEKEVRRLYRFKSDRRIICLDRESGQVFSDHETFTEGRTPYFHSGKTVDQPIPSLETEDSPRTASTGESPRKKRGPQYCSRDARALAWGSVSPNPSRAYSRCLWQVVV